MSTEEEPEGKLSLADIGEMMGGARKKAPPAEGTQVASAEAPQQVTKTPEAVQDKLAEGQMLEKMQEGMAGMSPAAQAPYYQLEPEQEFKNRTQNYVRALMNVGGKQG
jgi:hypothetical protein